MLPGASRLFERATRSEVALEVRRPRIVREGNHGVDEVLDRRFVAERSPLHAATMPLRPAHVFTGSAQPDYLPAGIVTPSSGSTQVRAPFGTSRAMGLTIFRRGSPAGQAADARSDLGADDLRRLVEIERGQRLLLQNAYEDTVVALARALESKDSGTGAHSQRVQRYALELADAVAPELLGDASAEHGFLLHDVGKIGIPDRILRKPGPLDPDERRLMETHTLVGERMLSDVSLLRGEGLKVVRSHHERWDGRGYPDRLAGDEIPIGARVFAVADTLDAFTNDRPYRAAGSWEDAVRLIASEASGQFDPDVVGAFQEREQAMWALQLEFGTPAALN